MWWRSIHARPRKRRAFVYVCSLLALLIYALPRLPKLAHGISGTFSFLWILFASLALAANLYFLVGADRERSRLLSTRFQDVREVREEEDHIEEGKRQLLQ